MRRHGPTPRAAHVRSSFRKLAQSLATDSIRWAEAVAARLGVGDHQFQRSLAAEAFGFAACQVGSLLKDEPDGVDALRQIFQAMQVVWDEKGHGRVGVSFGGNPSIQAFLQRPAGEVMAAGLPSVISGQGGTAATQIAREFQSATGLDASPLVDDGSNLAALVFYARVFVLARTQLLLPPGQQKQLMCAARQCRERFESTLRKSLARKSTKGSPSGIECSMKPVSLPPATQSPATM